MSLASNVLSLSETAKFLKTDDLKAARRLSVQFLYQLELTNHLFYSKHELEAFFKQNEVEDICKEYCAGLVKFSLENLSAIDEKLESGLKNWKLNRLGKVDLSVLRVGCAELLVRKDLKHQIIIADAVEIAKLFGSNQSGAFVNGVLDYFWKSIQTT